MVWNKDEINCVSHKVFSPVNSFDESLILFRVPYYG